MVSIDKGLKVYKGVDIVHGKPVPSGWKIGKMVQRCHQIFEEDGMLLVVRSVYLLFDLYQSIQLHYTFLCTLHITCIFCVIATGSKRGALCERQRCEQPEMCAGLPHVRRNTHIGPSALIAQFKFKISYIID
jgi:hypothetical protein